MIPRPKAWDSKGGSAEAWHFLADFNNFAQAQGEPLNRWDQAINVWHISPTMWIQSVMNLMEGDACTWALPHLESLQAGNPPFGGNWQTFTNAFTRQFAPLDTAEAA
jgi:hypothetical protein